MLQYLLAVLKVLVIESLGVGIMLGVFKIYLQINEK